MLKDSSIYKRKGNPLNLKEGLKLIKTKRCLENDQTTFKYVQLGCYKFAPRFGANRNFKLMYSRHQNWINKLCYELNKFVNSSYILIAISIAILSSSQTKQILNQKLQKHCLRSEIFNCLSTYVADGIYMYCWPDRVSRSRISCPAKL